MKPQHKKRLKQMLKPKRRDLAEALQIIIDSYSEEHRNFSMLLGKNPERSSEILAKMELSNGKKWRWILKILRESVKMPEIVFRICKMNPPKKFGAKREQILTGIIYPNWLDSGWSRQYFRLSQFLGKPIDPNDIRSMEQKKIKIGKYHSALVLEKCAQICPKPTPELV